MTAPPDQPPPPSDGAAAPCPGNDEASDGNPPNAARWFQRGNQCLDAGRIAEAIACFARCLEAEPAREEFICNLGHALIRAGRPAEALPYLRRLPQSADALTALGVAHSELGQLREARDAFRAATARRPGGFEAWSNLVSVLERLGELEPALDACNRAIALCPQSARKHFDRGLILGRLGQAEAAAAAFARALRVDPELLDARLALANAQHRVCDWHDSAGLRASVVEPVLRRIDDGESFAPFSLLTLSGDAVAPAELRRAAEARARQVARDAGGVPSRPPRRPASCLRIGYVSPDFGNHAVGHCVRTLFARHDRRRVSVHGFSLHRHPDGFYRDALRGGCDTWDDLDGLDDDRAAEAIRGRGIDVLVDLAGHTRHNRLGIFARRPAPVQATWLGYAGTTGADFIDHLLGDAVVTPEEADSAFTERVWRLPGCYLPFDDTQPVGPAGDPVADHGLPPGAVVCCAFNNSYKIEPLIFGAWMEILARVAGGILWLRSTGATGDENLRREARGRGVDPERLIFDGRLLPKPDHLARYRHAALFLDTHFYNAHSTAGEALWAGLPVLTWPGASFPSRVGASLVTALGVGDALIARDRDDYVARAVALATQPQLRQDLATRIDRARGSGGLFDTAAFARKLEDAFTAMAAAR